MNRKIIIKSDDLYQEIVSFLTGIGADMPVDWTAEALDQCVLCREFAICMQA